MTDGTHSRNIADTPLWLGESNIVGEVATFEQRIRNAARINLKRTGFNCRTHASDLREGRGIQRSGGVGRLGSAYLCRSWRICHSDLWGQAGSF
jgi:hypothetical protein